MAVFNSPNLWLFPKAHPLLPFKTTKFDVPWMHIELSDEYPNCIELTFRRGSEIGVPYDVIKQLQDDIRILYPKHFLGNTWIYPLKSLAELQFLFDLYELDCYAIHRRAIEAYMAQYASTKATVQRIPVSDDIFPPTVTPFQAQKDGVRWMVPRKRFCNNDDTGLGKTPQSIATVSEWFRLGLVDSLFVVVKDTLVYQWGEELLKFSTLFTANDIELVTFATKDGFLERARSKKVIVIGMRALAPGLYNYKATAKKKKPTKLSNTRWKEDAVNLKELWGKQSPCLVVDEVHKFNRTSSARTQALLSIRNQFEHKIILSATLSMTSFSGYYPIYRLVDDGIIPMTERAFDLFIAKSIGSRWSAFQINELCQDAIEICRKQFNKHTIKRLKKDQPDMKAEQDIVPRKFLLDEDRQLIYNYLLEQEIALIPPNSQGKVVVKQSFPHTVSCLDNAELLKGKVHPSEKKIFKLIERWHLGKDPKLAFCDERLEELIKEQGRKVIIFDHHPETLNYLAEHYEQYAPLVVHGQVRGRNEKSDEHKKALFNDSRSPHKLFLLQSYIGAEGWNLQQSCSNVIVYTCPTSSVLRQLVDRTHRIVSTENTLVEILVHAKTYDEIRYERAVARMQLNDVYLAKEDTVSADELAKLFQGAYRKESNILKV